MSRTACKQRGHRFLCRLGQQLHHELNRVLSVQFCRLQNRGEHAVGLAAFGTAGAEADLAHDHQEA
jgi:hypothetical protein